MGKKKIIPLTMMLLCSLCFSSGCAPKTTATTNIATIGDNKITTSDLYNSVIKGKISVEQAYKLALENLINSVAPATTSMKTKVDNDIQKWESELKANSELNKTDYKEDLAAALEEEGVSSIDELKDKRVYELQYEYAKEKFLEEDEETYIKAYIDNNYLYHASDITLSVGSSSTNTDLFNLTISSDEAKAMIDTFAELVKGEKYYNIAFNYSKGDEKNRGGDLGIVSLNDTEISNELRYALIGYSTLIENKQSEFNLPTNEYSLALNSFYSAGMQTIPYSYIKGMGDVASTSGTTETKYYESTTNFYNPSAGNSIGSGRVYYRNIIFNNLLNTKTPKFITVSDDDVTNGARAVQMEVLTPNVDSKGYSETKTMQNVLVNDQGNPYIVYKDGTGLHILSIHKTPFASDVYKYYAEDDEDNTYTSYAEFGSNVEERKEQIKDLAIKYINRQYGSNEGNDNFLSFAMFKYYLNSDKNANFKIVDDNLKVLIEQYINASLALEDANLAAEFKANYEKYSNIVWFRSQTTISQEIPLLACLVKQTDDNYGCSYTYGQGFKKYTPGG